MGDEGLSRRQFLRLVGAGAAMALPVSRLLAADARKPNVIVILSDDHGYGAMGCMGNWDIPTPNIDSIAKNGVRCTNGYVTCPICSPTRAGLMTGRYQQRFGHEDNPGPIPVAAPNFGLPLGEKTLADYMKALGYVTGIVGKWHLGHRPELHPRKRGFDEFFGFLTGAHSYADPGLNTLDPILRGTEKADEKEYLTDAFSREAVSFIERHKEKPFFLYLAFNAVHAPLQAPEKYLGRFTKIADQKRRTFAAMLSAMDDAVGRVLDTVRKNDLENDTLIIYLSDNGGPTASTTSRNDPLRGFKGQVYEGGHRIPYMMQWKGHVPAGKVYDKSVISLDIAPTALAVAGAEPKDAKFDGVNLLPFLTKDSGTPHDVLYWRYGEQYAIRKGDWKLLKTQDGQPELYNLADDISEKTDLSAKNPEKVKELSDLYEKWNSELAPPLWKTQRVPKANKPGKAGKQQKRKKLQQTTPTT
ncbi:MAG: sulfatase-like hydrolase/transferase [Armatimonadetes bacterium]|nr:sulfatase-like hydrolase/transferase [Armatimonadota bacterium]